MYNHIVVEKKWVAYWKKNKTFKFSDDESKKKFYVLDMFPYPSGSGLHVGHPKGYTASDIISRFKRLNGFSVLHPIGWDAFGLPAEQYAIQTGNHPKIFTYKNIDNFRNQLQRLGFDFDYDNEICTCDEKFYRWTQWIFVQLYENGLAKIENIDVNWCDNLKIVLANEEVLKNKNGENVSERGGHPVVKKKMRQWVLKITDFAEELLSGLDDIDWTDGLKNIQRKWIGKSKGSIVDFKIDSDSNLKVPVFTTKIETIYEVSFIGIAPDSDILQNILKNPSIEITNFIEGVKNVKDYEREKINSEKFGIKLDLNCINPITKELIPIYIVNYILPKYGTGAIMGVPSKDKRDHLFAEKYNLKIINNLSKNIDLEEMKNNIISELEKMKVYKDSITYKLRDWLFSRQRYWGEPFPILFDEKGNILVEKNLPLILPQLENFSPSQDGKSPLNDAKDWIHTTIDNVKYIRDTNTMPQWAGSCWYYIAYIIKNSDGTYLDLDSKEAKKRLNRWLPVDIYIGGQEHAVLHLLYARFWHKFLYKIGIVDCLEPFQKMVNQGMILDNIGNKISKSVGNVISIDEICDDYGADTLRLYEMFMGPITQTAKWSNNSVSSLKTWINKIYQIYQTVKLIDDDEILKIEFHKMASGVTQDLENLQFNIAISKMMIFINCCTKKQELSKKHMENFLIILSCFCPFITQEIYSLIFKKTDQISFREWPKFNLQFLEKKIMNLPITINGKIRDIIEIKLDENEENIKILLEKSIKIQKFLLGKKIIREIYVRNKIYNILVK